MKKSWIVILTAVVMMMFGTAVYAQAGQTAKAPVEVAGMVIEYEMISCDSAAPEF